MGLKINFVDKTRSNNITENCYVKAEKNLNGNNKSGALELKVWCSKADRDSNSRKINQISIPVSLGVEKKDTDGNIENINYYNVEFVSGENFYAYIKGLKIRVTGTIILMNTATDWN